MIKKRTHPKFNVPNLGAKHRKRVPERWRKQRGIDSKKRVYKNGSGASPSIGYKNPKEVRYARPDGSFEMLIHNEKELHGMPSEIRIGRFAHELSTRKREMLRKIAEKKGVRMVN